MKIKSILIFCSLLIQAEAFASHLTHIRSLKASIAQSQKVLSHHISLVRYIKCLVKSTYFLCLFDDACYYYSPCNSICKDCCIQIDSTHFFHPETQKCISLMFAHKSLKPIIQLSKKIYDQYPCDYLLMHEILLLTFTVYKQIIVSECSYEYRPKKTSLDQIIEISEKINQLPIAEVINTIDMLITELPPLLEKYEVNSHITWRAWVKKYWWVPPVFGSWFTLKILFSLQRSYYYYAPDITNRPQKPRPIISNDKDWPEIANIRKDS